MPTLGKRLRPGVASIIATGYACIVPGARNMPEFAVKLNKPFDKEQLAGAVRVR